MQPLKSGSGETLALIPSRYPGSQASADGAVQLGRRTDWLEAHPDVWTGLGQRMFNSDQGEHPMLGLERIDFNVTADA